MTDGRLEVGLPTILFAGVIADPITDHYAVTADGQGGGGQVLHCAS